MTPLFGPGWGNYAIAGIVETALPESVSLLPQTPGWALLTALLIAYLAYRLLVLWRSYRRNQYRRDALAALAHLQQRIEAGDEQALRELAPLLRATALRAAPASKLVRLSGDAWATAIGDLAPGLPALPMDTLQSLAYAPLPPPKDIDYHSLLERMEFWIREHELSDA